MQIRDHVWASATYQALATALLTREGLKARPSAAAGSLLGDLTDLRLGVLLAANQRLSAQLSDHPLDPGTHERAALLLGALGLREGSGPFADLRPTLSGMAAHLALAAALRAGAPSSPEGQVAAVLVDVLSGRVVPAAADIARLEAGPHVPGLRPWLRALALRATRGSGALESHGFVRAADAADADVLLLNTCSIREKAQDKVFAELGRLQPLKERRPDLVIADCGCVAQQEGDRIFERAPYVDLVIGTRATGSLPILV